MRTKPKWKAWKPKPPLRFELSVEDVAKVEQELSQFTALFHPAFGRREPAEKFDLYFKGLLSDAERKNMEAIALKLQGPEEVRNLQRLMSHTKWDESWMRERHWELTSESLNDPLGVWKTSKVRDREGILPDSHDNFLPEYRETEQSWCSERIWQ